MDPLAIGLELLGGLGIFLYGLKVMSDGLQKAAGTRLRGLLSTATGNRFSATATGVLVTTIIQSSSATTVMVVAFCSAGLLTLFQALGIIFGANIGTTVTGWIVSLLGFKVKIGAIALPLAGIGFFAQFANRWPTVQKVGETLIGFGLLFLGLDILKDAIPDLRESPAIEVWLGAFDADFLLPRLAIVAVGTLLTVIFQSSSAMMAVTLTAAAKGLIDWPTAAALVLGENIGTTVTANMAAIGAPTVAKQAARGHFLFNVIGVTWVVALFGPMLRFVDWLAPGDPMLATEEARTGVLTIHIAAFHTVFNVANTAIMLPLMRPLERLVLRMVPSHVEEPELRFLKNPFADTAALALSAARHEVDHMAAVVVDQVQQVRDAIRAPEAEFAELAQKVRDAEEKTDRLEHEIGDYLAQLLRSGLPAEATQEALHLLDMANDLERIGDHGDKLIKLLHRHRTGRFTLSEQATANLDEMSASVVEIVREMRRAILDPTRAHVSGAREREKALNKLRNRFRDAHLERLASGACGASAALLFSDMLMSFERLGDHALKVVYNAVGQKEVFETAREPARAVVTEPSTQT